MTNSNFDLNGVVKEIAELDEINTKQKRVLAQLLDLELAKKDQFIALKGEMGEIVGVGTSQLIPSYNSTHTLDWIGTFVKMGSEMPFMRSKIDEKGRVIVDESNVDKIQQRSPDWTRQTALAAYLLSDNNRKFGTILAVLSPAWVDNPNHENWGKDGRALKSSVSFKALDSAGLIGVLDLNDTHIYALDGQHRVMGVKGVKALQDHGKIVIMKKDGSHTSKVYTREEFLDVVQSDITQLQKVLNERITVEYIPAVLAGETRKEATQRVRSVFVAINSYAKRPDKGENILLDESDGYAIVARSIGVHHPLLKSPKGSRVNWNNTSLPKASLWYTTLQALRDMIENYIQVIKPELAKAWEPKFNGMVPSTPKESEIEFASETFYELWNHIANIPVYKGLESGDVLQKVREFPPEGINGHILVRPIGQTILAKVVGRLIVKGMTLEEIFEKINKLDRLGGFEAHRPENIWWGVTFNPSKDGMIASTSNQEFAAKLFEYMLRGAEEPERTKLRFDLMKYREGSEGNIMSFDGEWLTNSDDFDLPVPVK